jgi:hypothetical protein
LLWILDLVVKSDVMFLLGMFEMIDVFYSCFEEGDGDGDVVIACTLYVTLLLLVVVVLLLLCDV